MNNEIQNQKEKLLKLQTLQVQMKAANKVLRNNQHSDETKRAFLASLGYDNRSINDLMRPDYCGRIGFSYHLTNNNAVIKNTQKRIADLEAKEKAADEAAKDIPLFWECENGRIFLNYELDRIQVFYTSKPDETTRSNLKHNGFNWSPTNGAWQRKITNNAIYTTNRLFGTAIPSM